jgi:hypothetical protein
MRRAGSDRRRGRGREHRGPPRRHLFSGDKWSREDPSLRRPDCDAWDTRYHVTLGANLATKQAFLGTTFTDRPTNEQDCLLSWMSELVWVNLSSLTWRAKDQDSVMEWTGFDCIHAGEFAVTPPWPPGVPPGQASLVWFTRHDEPGTAFNDWHSTYRVIDVQVQSFWAFWSVRSSVYLNVH